MRVFKECELFQTNKLNHSDIVMCHLQSDRVFSSNIKHLRKRMKIRWQNYLEKSKFRSRFSLNPRISINLRSPNAGELLVANFNLKPVIPIVDIIFPHNSPPPFNLFVPYFTIHSCFWSLNSSISIVERYYLKFTDSQELGNCLRR